jgi:tetratricopeptide (TPR) repeat protein
MADIFISYASQDRERARMLASALEAHGWSVWWDRKIIAGQTFDQVIERELDAAKSVVVLWSKNSVASEWVKNEAAAAAERGVLIPALVDAVKLPLEFRRKQTVDLVGWEGDASEAGFKALCDGVSAILTGVVPQEKIAIVQRRLKWNRRWTLGSVAAIAVAMGSVVYWVSPWQDQQTGPPAVQSGYRNDILRDLWDAQRKALEMLEKGKSHEAIALIDKNLKAADEALRSFPNDPEFHSQMGYMLKDVYQSSKRLLSPETRRKYLTRARESFQEALRLDPNNAGAHNGMGNVLFFEGKFDAAIKEHDIALRLRGGNYPDAEHDKGLVMRVRDGEIPFDF